MNGLHGFLRALDLNGFLRAPTDTQQLEFRRLCEKGLLKDNFTRYAGTPIHAFTTTFVAVVIDIPSISVKKCGAALTQLFEGRPYVALSTIGNGAEITGKSLIQMVVIVSAIFSGIFFPQKTYGWLREINAIDSKIAEREEKVAGQLALKEQKQPNTVKDLHKQISAKAIEIEKLTLEMVALKEENSRSESEVKGLKINGYDQNVAFNKKVQELESQRNALEESNKKIEQLQGTLDLARTEKSQLEQRLSFAELTLKESNEKHEEVQNRIKELEAAESANKEAFEGKVQELESQRNALEESSKKIEQLQGTLDLARTEKSQLEQRLSSAELTLKESNEKHEEVQNRIKELEAAESANKEAFEGKVKELESQRNALEESNKKIEQLKGTLDSAEAKKTQLEQQLLASTATNGGQILRVSDEVLTKANEKIEELTKQITALNVEKEEAQRSATNSNSKLESTQKRLTETQEKYKKQLELTKSMGKTARDTNTILEKKNLEVKELKKVLDGLKVTNKQLLTELKEAQAASALK